MPTQRITDTRFRYDSAGRVTMNGLTRYGVRNRDGEVVYYWIDSKTPTPQAVSIAEGSRDASEANGGVAQGTDEKGFFLQDTTVNEVTPGDINAPEVAQGQVFTESRTPNINQLAPRPGQQPSQIRIPENVQNPSFLQRLFGQRGGPGQPETTGELFTRPVGLAQQGVGLANAAINSPAPQFIAREGPGYVGSLIGRGAALAAGQPAAAPVLGGIGGAGATTLRDLINYGTGVSPEFNPNPMELVHQAMQGFGEGATPIAQAGSRTSRFFGRGQPNPVLQGVPSGGRSPTVSMSPVQELLLKHRVPADVARQQGFAPEWMAIFSNLLRRTPFSAPAFLRSERRTSAALNRAWNNIGKQISTLRLSPKEAGNQFQAAWTEFNKIASENYDGVVGRIIQKGDVPIPKEEAASRAVDILERLRGTYRVTPSLQSTYGKVEELLEDFALWDARYVPSEAVRAARVPNLHPRVVTFSDARTLREYLMDMSRDNNLPMPKRQLKEMIGVLHDSMTGGLKQVGRGADGREFEFTSRRYREMLELGQQEAIKSAINTKQPETILGMLLETGAQSSGEALNTMTRKDPQVRGHIQRALWDHLFKESSVENVLVGNKAERVFERIGDDALSAIFGPKTFREVKEFVGLINEMHLPASITKPPIAQSMSLLAQGVSGALLGGVGMMFVSPGDVVQFVGGGIMSTKVFAWVLTRPGAVDMATRILKSPAGSRAQAEAVAGLQRIASTITTEFLKDESAFPLPTPPGEVNLPPIQ